MTPTLHSDSQATVAVVALDAEIALELSTIDGDAISVALTPKRARIVRDLLAQAIYTIEGRQPFAVADCPSCPG